MLYEFCLSVFIETYPSVCMSSCDPSKFEVVPYSCPNLISHASTGITIKTGLPICKGARSSAIQWMTERFTTYEELSNGKKYR
ncbi:unnamed protein product [Heterosigma akashiwo]